MHPTLFLDNDGKLILTSLNSSTRRTERKDVTDRVTDFLFHEINFDDNVTLYQIFSLLRSEIDFFGRLYAPFCKSLVTEAFEDYTGANQHPAGSYLSIYRRIMAEENMDGADFINFAPLDFCYAEIDPNSDEEVLMALDLCAPSTILDLPVKLQSTATLFPRSDSYESIKYSAIYTLNDVFLAIMEELSFYGDKQNRQDVAMSLEAAENKWKGKQIR
jgi:hypothetical protein